ncbi:TrkA C-terminal domain-containing protein [Asanoa iriomotensis]|uniref:RCK C-terminal domain-containing protein n=1 Tax=Asanoa iriomotensis TaxID=234613 RepID=A0ABQ4CD62_9ACTN|nr:TrkA C-terminal domain-containing protein [Asanoa iriomotensis]GIF60713.1 hypothetical protein Air01nite_68080 [Asanoa iriomotensis]
MFVERTLLPGVGASHAVTTGRRQRIGVVAHHSGQRDVILYDPDDPGRAAATVALDGREARQVAELLAGTVAVDQLDTSVWRIRVPATSPYIGRLLPRGTPEVVVVVRADRAIAPHGDLTLLAGDLLVVVGDRTAVDKLAHALG